MIFKIFFSCPFFPVGSIFSSYMRNSLPSVKTEFRAVLFPGEVRVSCGTRKCVGGQGSWWQVWEQAPSVVHTIHVAKPASCAVGQSGGPGVSPPCPSRRVPACPHCPPWGSCGALTSRAGGAVTAAQLRWWRLELVRNFLMQLLWWKVPKRNTNHFCKKKKK